ncbi:CRISPR-associated endonuclease Cas2 [Candidatus Daviesbacteria bacterium]|nr:CRISPR-associated endonuclease Cas2 [Candidatus Daviesbacteria bacterium]
MGKKESIGKLVLLALEKAVDGYVRFEDFTYHHYRYHYGIPELKKSSLAQAIKRLREKGFVEKTTLKDEGKIIFKLTEAGKEFLLLSKSDEEIDWDGKWRIVVFDIPEKQRKIRNILRSRLKMWGFTPWQQSVWASKKNVTEKLRRLIKELEIDDWVLVLESDNAGR